MNGSFLATLALGFGLGLKHALDADHLVAICTIAGRERSLWRSSLIGALWGLGHTASLFVAAVLVIVLRVSISPTVATSMEFCVGIMLIGLSVDFLCRVRRGEMRIHSHRHVHDGAEHAHLHVHAEGAADHTHHGIGHKPFFIGVMHGLAGSAALTLFVLSTIASPWAGMLYVAVFGAGTVAGMLIMSSLISLPFNLASRKLQGLADPLQLGIGLGSFAFGVFYTWQILVDERLLGTFLH